MSVKAHECITFPFELAIEPVASLQALGQLQGSCVSSAAPTLALGDAPVDVVLQHALATALALDVALFNVTEMTYIDLTADFDFLSGGIELELVGSVPRGSSGRFLRERLEPRYAQGRAFLQQVLLPGSYELSLTDTESLSTITGALSGVATCSPYSVHFESRTRNLPDFNCYGYDKLPTSAASYTSWAYESFWFSFDLFHLLKRALRVALVDHKTRLLAKLCCLATTFFWTRRTKRPTNMSSLSSNNRALCASTWVPARTTTSTFTCTRM